MTVLVWESEAMELRIAAQVRRLGFTVLTAADLEAALRGSTARPLGAVLVVAADAASTPPAEMAILRRAHPDVPFAIVAGSDTLDLRERFAGLRPVYWAVAPADDAELRDLLTSARSRRVART